MTARVLALDRDGRGGGASRGALMTLFYAASGVGQMISGFLVDRLGARRLLVGGLSLLAGAIGAAGLTTSYWMLIPILVLVLASGVPAQALLTAYRGEPRAVFVVAAARMVLTILTVLEVPARVWRPGPTHER